MWGWRRGGALTAGHCLEVEELALIGRHYATTEYATQFDGRRYPVRPNRVGDGVDVALLEFPEEYRGHALLIMPISQGSSGSAALTLSGRIAGIVATIFQPSSNGGSPIALMVPSDLNRAFLEDDELAKVTAY